MVKRDGAFTRSERLNELRRFLQGCKEPLPFRKTVAVFQLKHGLTKEKIKEYLCVIEDLGDIQVDEAADKITPVFNGEVT